LRKRIEYGKAMFISGWDGEEEQMSTEVFDLDVGTNLDDACGVAEHTSPNSGGNAIVRDGRVLLCGGHEPYSRDCFSYDPQSNEWSDAPKMPGSKFGAASVLMPDGRWLLFGGKDEINDLDTDSAFVMAADADTFVEEPLLALPYISK